MNEVSDVPFVPVTGESAATTFACPLCGGRFSHGLEVCGSCPLHAGCDVVRCPHCGYQFPRTSTLVEWGRKVVHRLRRRP